MLQYYARRAQEYEKIYDKPERQPELAALHTQLPSLLAGRHVYEVACGTGYWTQFVAPHAASVFATDYNEEVLALAREKPITRHRVTFAQADAFNLSAPPHPCDAGLAAFWWSHLRRGRQLGEFLRGFFACLGPNARVVFLDNCYVAGSSTAISRTDAEGNTFQTRRLADGSDHEVLKNFPTETEFRTALAPYADAIHWEAAEYFWLAWADLR